MLSKNLRLSTLILILATFVTNALPQKSDLSEKKEAEKAWESLIKTKGGREKLHSVNSMLYEFPVDLTRLWVLPNRLWEFSSFMFTGAVISDGVKGVQYYAREDGVHNTEHDDLSLWYSTQVLPFLLETKWQKPELLRVKRVKDGKKTLEIIETMVGGRQMDFVYEIEEMLVSEVRFYDQKGRMWQVYAFSNYTTIDGIKMPQTYGQKSGYTEKAISKFAVLPIKFTFNVDYDPELFDRPLKATTSDAWKRKVKE